MKYSDQLILINLRKRNQIIFFLKVIICFTTFFVLINLIISLSFPSYIVSQFFLGALYVHMKELQHEALHGAIQWKNLNRLLGFILGVPMLVSFTEYQYYHLLHHKYMGTDKDTEYFVYNKKALNFYSFILNLFMFEHYLIVLKKIAKVILFKELKIKQKNVRNKIKNEYKFLVIFILGGIFLSIINQSLLILKIWFVPLVLFSIPINFLIELPEHIFCKKNTTNMFYNTRTIKSYWLMSWFVNGNNYHVEHHYAPYYPISFLSTLHYEIKNKIIYFNKSYFDFYKSFLKKCIQQK